MGGPEKGLPQARAGFGQAAGGGAQDTSLRATEGSGLAGRELETERVGRSLIRASRVPAGTPEARPRARGSGETTPARLGPSSTQYRAPSCTAQVAAALSLCPRLRHGRSSELLLRTQQGRRSQGTARPPKSTPCLVWGHLSGQVPRQRGGHLVVFAQ